jgi:tetratricopeptide (TPR) repeat protein
MKAFGLAKEAMPYYEKAKLIYEDKLENDDYKLAAFYNNISSAYKDIGDRKKAEESCFTAIKILEGKRGYLGEIAVTFINIAHIYYDADPFDERVNEFMEKAWDLLNSEKNAHDGNFAFICSKCYPSFEYFGYFEQATKLKELTEKIYEGN